MERPLQYEQALGCGIGQDANCCAFLMVGASGFECHQRSELADILYRRAMAGEMHARRTPEGDFPACQDEGRK